MQAISASHLKIAVFPKDGQKWQDDINKWLESQGHNTYVYRVMETLESVTIVYGMPPE
jgi:hypothetical protein